MTRSEIAALTAAAGLLCALGASARPVKRAPGHPAPRAAISLNLGDQVTIGGQSFTVSYGLIPVGSTPPPVAHLIGFTTNGPTFAGAAIVTGLLTLDSPAAVGGLPVMVTSSAPGVLASPGVITVAAGATSTTFSATASSPTATTPVTLTAAAGGITKSAAVTILGSSAVPMAIYGYRDGNRNPAISFGPGQTVFIDGVGFGAALGKVTVNNNVLPTQKWTDSEVEIICPPLATGAPAARCVLDIRRSDGQDFNTTLGFTIVPPPVRPAGG